MKDDTKYVISRDGRIITYEDWLELIESERG